MTVQSDEALDDARLILAAAHTLFVNGEDTSGVLNRTAQLAGAMGRETRVVPRWDEIALIEGERPLLTAPAVPWAINMRRVAATLALIDRYPAEGGRADWQRQLAEAAALPAYNVALFAFAGAFGAFALTYLNGATHWIVPLIAAVGAAINGFVRRGLGAVGANDLAQLFAATLIAGALGGVAVRLGVDFASGLVALGPLFVLVPGPALIGGAIDLAALRVSLGAARVGFGLLCIAVLSAGVLIGAAAAGGVAPDPQMPAGVLPIWADMACAAAASAAYAVFFVMPARMMALPILMGALAHGLRWVALNEWGWSAAAAAGLGCLLVGVVVEPLARHWRLPFAAVGFASVVAQVPGALLFRMSSGLVELQHLGAGASVGRRARRAAAGATALLTLIAMTLGLTIPKAIAMGLVARSSGGTPTSHRQHR